MYLSERPRRPRERSRGSTPRVGSTVVLLGLVSLFTDLSSEGVNAVLPLYLTTVVGLSPLAFGVADGVNQGATTILRFVGGWAADRSERAKPVAVVGYAASAVARAGLLVVGSFAGILSVLLVDRLGKGLRTAPRDALIAAASPRAAWGRAFGVHRSLDTTGALLGPLVALVVLAAAGHDYPTVFVVCLASALIGLALLVLVVPDVRTPPRPAAAPPRPSAELLRNSGLGRLCAAAGLLGLLTVGDSFLYLVLQTRNSFPALAFPLLLIGTNLSFLLLAVPLGRLADRVGRVGVLVGGHLLLAVAYLLAGGPLRGPLVATLALLALGAFYAATDGVLPAVAGALVRDSLRGRGIATAQSVVAVARFVASVGFGALWLAMGSGRAMCAVGLALLLLVPVARRLAPHDLRPAGGAS